MHAILPLLKQAGFPSLTREPLSTLQVNLGYRCNQQCLHCHVGANPQRKEIMTATTAEEVAAFIEEHPLAVLDLTGGAPELNSNFRELVRCARARGLRVLDRCNLTVLDEPGQEDTADFLAANRVEITASLPCYLEENVDRQRGDGVFARSIAVLQRLNALGYGRGETGLVLNLVFNPQGPSLPPPQERLEADYRVHLGERFGVTFNRLLTLANMPIQRFGSQLVSRGMFSDYMQLLRDAHRNENLDGVMCRTLISVDWQGYVYDCDFNQMLGLPLPWLNGGRPHLRDLMRIRMEGRPIAVRDHCYGCTAGQGSSCGGALS